MFLAKRRVEERMSEETGQLALARCVMFGVLGRERSRARKFKNDGSKQNFESSLLRMNGKTFFIAVC